MHRKKQRKTTEIGVRSFPGAAFVQLDLAEVWLYNVPLDSWGDL